MWVKAETHQGQKRSNNQDYFAVGNIENCAYCIVCDGMGGENGGQIASQMAVKTMKGQIERGINTKLDTMEVDRVLLCAANAANSEIFEKAIIDPTLKGMGTTMVATILINHELHFIHAGDSRAYLLHDEMLTQLSTDHTLVQMLLDNGEITNEEAVNHPKRNYITRAVGAEAKIRFDQFAIPAVAGDAVLLCSDGLYNFVPYMDLGALTVIATKKQDVWPLINTANENGGGDNITAAILFVEKEDC